MYQRFNTAGGPGLLNISHAKSFDDPG